MGIIQKITDFYVSLPSIQRTILTILLVLFIFYLLFKANLWWVKQRKVAELKAGAMFDKKQNKKKQKELKKQREKYSEVYLGNPILEKILQAFNIIIFGGLGAGKTLFANLLVHYLNMKYKKADKRSRRYNKYMRPDYLKEIQQLQEKKPTSNLCKYGPRR